MWCGRAGTAGHGPVRAGAAGTLPSAAGRGGCELWRRAERVRARARPLGSGCIWRASALPRCAPKPRSLFGGAWGPRARARQMRRARDVQDPPATACLRQHVRLQVHGAVAGGAQQAPRLASARCQAPAVTAGRARTRTVHGAEHAICFAGPRCSSAAARVQAAPQQLAGCAGCGRATRAGRRCRQRLVRVRLRGAGGCRRWWRKSEGRAARRHRRRNTRRRTAAAPCLTAGRVRTQGAGRRAGRAAAARRARGLRRAAAVPDAAADGVRAGAPGARSQAPPPWRLLE
jgi:hypothetical protein